MKKNHSYQLTITFESTTPVTKFADALIQFENGIPYFTKGDINNSFVYGSGKVKLTKNPKGKKL